MKTGVSTIILFILYGLFISGCSGKSDQSKPSQIYSTVPGEGILTKELNMFELSSPAFSENGYIAEKYAYNLGRQCSGENYSPPLEWKGVPSGTKSLLLTMIDPDGGNWVHWVVANIPADASVLAEVINGPDSGIAGRNDFGGNGYGGPCPPSGTHHYIFTLYALNTNLDVKPGFTLNSISPLDESLILGKAVLTGLKMAK